jgi:hypothetical protein
MDGAHEVRTLSVELEREVTFGVGLGASGFFHALTEREENDFVSGGRFAGVEFLTVPVRVWADMRVETRRLARKAIRRVASRLSRRKKRDAAQSCSCWFPYRAVELRSTGQPRAAVPK